MARVKKAQAGQVTIEEREQQWREYAAKLNEAHSEAIVALNEAHQAELLKQEKSHAEQIRTLTAKHRKEGVEIVDAAEKKVASANQVVRHLEDKVARLHTFLDNLVELDPDLERFRILNQWQFADVQTAVDHLRTSRLVENFQAKPKATGLKLPKE